MRLGKQRVEAYQLLKVNLGLGKRNKNGNIAWSNHPAAKMWKGYELLLYMYTTDIISEWKSRGYNDSIQEKIDELKDKYISQKKLTYPLWLWFSDDLCLSHRSNLIRKLPEHYKQFWPDVPDDLPYVWPV